MLEALSILGYGIAYNSREMLRRNHIDFCGQGFRAKHEGGRPFAIEQFESLWGDYKAISGEPAYIFAAECIELYPDAKIILTVRSDEEKWLQSLKNTMWYGHQLRTSKFLSYVDGVQAKMRNFTDPYFKYMFGGDVPNHGIRAYREHNAMVQRLAKGRLLVHDTQEGWDPLCQFLGKDVPSSSFPHVNKTDEHRAIFGNARKQALKAFVMRLLGKGLLPLMIAILILRKRRGIVTMLKSLKQSAMD